MPVTRDPRGRIFTTGDVTRNSLLGEASVTLSNSSGVAAQEFYLVEGLEGSTALQRLHAATLAPGIPRRGVLHPLLSVPVESVRAQFVNRDITQAAIVEVNYGLVQGGGGFENDPDDEGAMPQIEILSTLQPIQTEFDVHGNVLVIDNYVTTIFDDSDPPVAIGSQSHPPQAGEVEVTADMHTIIARRRERISPGVIKGPTHTNTINSGTVFGDPAYVWKCAIGGSTDDGGDSWNVVYEFQRNFPDTWNKVIVWRDPETGLPGAEVTRPPNMTPGSTGNGSKVTRHFRSSNFRNLNLPIFD